jgi:TRAP-type C4-dicarboxylate transport system permease small subunit
MDGNMNRPRFVLFIDQLARITEKVAAFPCMVTIGAMTAIVIAGVFFRYVLLQPIGWSEEAARYLMIWAASLAVSLGIMKGEHVGLIFIVETFPPKLKRFVSVFTNLAILLFLWVLTERGYEIAIKGRSQVSSLLDISMIWSLIAVPIAGGLAMIQTVFLILKIIFLPPAPQKMEQRGN